MDVVHPVCTAPFECSDPNIFVMSAHHSNGTDALPLGLAVPAYLLTPSIVDYHNHDSIASVIGFH